MVWPEQSAQLVDSMLKIAKIGGALPRWMLANIYAGSMVGNHANVIIYDAFARDVPMDAQTAFVHMSQSIRNASLPHAHRGAALLDAWLKKGYLPDNLGESRSAAVALDWALDDHVTAQMAKALGKVAEYKDFASKKDGLFVWRLD